MWLPDFENHFAPIDSLRANGQTVPSPTTNRRLHGEVPRSFFPHDRATAIPIVEVVVRLPVVFVDLRLFLIPSAPDVTSTFTSSDRSGLYTALGASAGLMFWSVVTHFPLRVNTMPPLSAASSAARSRVSRMLRPSVLQTRDWAPGDSPTTAAAQWRPCGERACNRDLEDRLAPRDYLELLRTSVDVNEIKLHNWPQIGRTWNRERALAAIGTLRRAQHPS